MCYKIINYEHEHFNSENILRQNKFFVTMMGVNPIGHHNYSIALALACQCVRCLPRVWINTDQTKYKALGNFIVKFNG